MARVPGTFARPLIWALATGPAYEGLEPRPLRAACHDGSPCIDVVCGFCQATAHMHESQFAGMPVDAEVAMRCPVCRRANVFPPGFVRDAFQRLRDEGWVAYDS